MINETIENESRQSWRTVLMVSLFPCLIILVSSGLLAGGLIFFNRDNNLFIPYHYVCAVGLSVVSSFLGGFAFGLISRYHPSYIAQGSLMGMGIRMFVMLAGILFFILILKEYRLQFLGYGASLYFVGLIAEIIVAVRVAGNKRIT
jgi:hypothetical protein